MRPSLDEIYSGIATSNINGRPSLDEIYARDKKAVPTSMERATRDILREGGSKLYDVTHGIYETPEGKQQVKQPIGLTAVQALGSELGILGNVAGQGIANVASAGFNALPERWQDIAKQKANDIIRSDIGQKGIEAMKFGGDIWDAFAEKNPVVARTLGAVGNIGAFVTPIPGLGRSGARLTKEAAEVGSGALKNIAGDIVEGAKPLPPIPSAESVKDISRTSFKEADEIGGKLKPENSIKFVDSLESLKKQTKWGEATTGEDAITKLVERYKPLKDEPITLAAAQEIDEGLGQLIDGFYDAKGKISKEGLKVQKAQHAFRDMIENIPESEIEGGKAGFDAWKRGQKEWSTAVRLAEMERIIARAETMDNPATSLKAGFRMLERTGMRGYSDAEKKAIREAARSGVIGSTLRTVLGSRLIGTGIGTIVGATGGPVSAALGGTIGAAQSGLSRKAAESIAMKRVNKARREVANRIGEMSPREALRILEGKD